MKQYGSLSPTTSANKNSSSAECGYNNCEDIISNSDWYYQTPSKEKLSTIEALKANLMNEQRQLLTNDHTSATSSSSSSQDDRRERSLRSFDDDRVSTGSDDSYMPKCGDWSSNICFLFGSMLYVWLAVWDIIDADVDDDDNGDDDDGLDDKAGWMARFIDKRFHILRYIYNLCAYDMYTLVSAVAALFYVADAAFQISQLTCHHDDDSKQPSHRVPHVTPLIFGPSDNHIERNEQDSIQQVDFHYLAQSESSELAPVPIAQRSRCFQLNWKGASAFLVGITFGVGAACDLASSFLVDEQEKLSDRLGMYANHFYLINALLVTVPTFMTTCTSRRGFCNRRIYFSDGLEYVGDFLFLSGSIIDVTISWWQMETSWKAVEWFSLLSAVLWLIDAILYIAADCIVCNEIDDDDDEDDDTMQLNDPGSPRSSNNGEMVIIVDSQDENNVNEENDVTILSASC